MTTTEAADILRQFNEWQRGHNTVLRPSSNELGEAIDAAVEMIDRLEAAEKSRDDLLAGLDEWLDKTKWVQQGINEGTISAKYLGLHRADVMTSLLGEAEKERDALRAAVRHEADCVEAAKAEIKALRAKIERMEKQEPVGEIQRANSTGNYNNSVVWVPMAVGSKLYALPGAQTQGEGK